MANTVIALKKSGTPSATPASLEFGELAINYADGVLYYKAANGSIYPFASGGNAFATVNANGTLVVADTASDVFSLVPGNYINITGDGINDSITISANVKPLFDQINTAAKVTMSNSAPIGAGSGDFWWNSDLGRLFVYYIDNDTSQWVEATALLGPDYGLVYDVANAAFDQANSSVSGGLGPIANTVNAAFNAANSAFDKANNAIANTSNVIIYGDLRVTGTLNVGNSTTTITTSNVTANNITISSRLIVNSVDILTTVNAAFAAANSGGSGDTLATAFTTANAAFDKANSANLLAFNTGIGANSFTSATIDGANAAVGSGANSVGSAAFTRANTANTTAKFAFDKANAGSNVSFTQFVIKGGGNVNIIYANSNSSSFNIETGNGVTYSNTANGINLGLTTTGVTAGYYGANNVIPIIDVDEFGRVRSVTNVAAQAASVNGTVIINSTVNNQKLANVSQGTVKGRANTGTGEVEDLTFTQFVNSLPTFTTTNRGVVPATGPLANNFLRDDATWVYINPELANIAFNFANTANALAYKANINAVAAFAQANIAIANVNYVNTAMQAAFASLNIAIANINFTNTEASAAFAQANIAIANVNYVNTAMQSAFATLNIAIANINFTNTEASAAFAQANIANTTAIAAFNAANSLVVAAGGVTTSDTPPVSPTSNQLWFDSSTATLRIYYNDGTSAQWVDVVPLGAENGYNEIILPNEVTANANLASSDAGSIVIANSSSDIYLTIPNNNNTVIPINTKIKIHRKGTGQVKVIPAANVTFSLPTGIKPKVSMGVYAYRPSPHTTGYNPTGPGTVTAFDSEYYDTHGFHNSSNTALFIIPSALGIKKVDIASSATVQLNSSYLEVYLLKANTITARTLVNNTFGNSSHGISMLGIPVTDGESFALMLASGDTSMSFNDPNTYFTMSVSEIDAQGFVAYQNGIIEIQKIGTNEWIVSDQSALG